MQSPPVLIVGPEDALEPLVAGLAAHELAAEVVPLGTLEKRIGSPASALVLTGLPGDAALRMIGHLQRKAAGALPPIVVALTRPGAEVRDRYLLAGVADVVLEPAPEQLCLRVETIVRGWLRAAPLRPWPVVLTVHRGAGWFPVHLQNIDPTGVGLTDEGTFEPGELLRLTVPLSDGELPLWGRVDRADGLPGIRFVGVAMDERWRLKQALSAGLLPTPGTPETTEEEEPFQAPRRKWPAEHVDLVATDRALEGIASSGYTRVGAGAPSVEHLREFLQQLPPPFQKVYDLEAPDDIPEPLVVRQALAAQAHLFAARHTGEELWREGTEIEVSASGVEQLAVGAGMLLQALPRLMSEAAAHGRADHLQALAQLQQQLTHEIEALRPVLARLGAEFPVPVPKGTLPLFPALPQPGQQVGPAPALPPVEELPPTEPEVPAFERKPRRWLRWLGLGVALALLVGAAIWFRPSMAKPPRPSSEYIAEIPGVTGVLLTADEARVLVVNGWHPSDEDVERLRQYLLALHKPQARVIDAEQRTLAVGRPDDLRLP